LTVSSAITAGGASIANAEFVNVAQNGGNGSVVTGSGLMVSLNSMTPSAGSIVVDATVDNAQAYIPFLKVNLTAAPDGPITVNTLKFKRAGLPSADTDLSSFQLYDGDTKLADYSSFTDSVVTFNRAGGLITIPAGTTKTVTLTADLADAVSASRNIHFTIDSASDIVASAANVSGSFPITGNTMNVVDIGNNELGTLAVATVSNGVGNEPGTTAQDLWKFKLTGANKKVDIHKVKLTMIGTVSSNDLQNLKLYQGSTQLGATVANLGSDNTVTFDFATPFEIDKTNKDFVLKGDIVGGTDRTYKFSIQSMDDIVVYDKEINVRIKPGSADNWTVVQAAGSTTITTGSLTIARKLNVANTDLAADATDQVFASFDFNATGERIKVTDIYIEAVTSGGGLDNGKIFVDGSQVGSTQDLTEATAVTFALGNSLIIEAGQTKTVEVRADVKKANGTSFAADNTAIIHLSSINGGGADGNAASYQKMVSMGTATVPALSGYSRTIRSGSLTTARNTAVADWSVSNPTAVQGQTEVLVGSFTATVGSGEAVDITDVQITDNDAAFTQLQNLKVKVDGSFVGSTVTTPVAGTTYTFNVSPYKRANASSQVVIEVYADVKASASLATPDAIVLAQVSATGVTTSADAKDANDRTGQVLHTVPSGSLTIVADPDTANAAQIVMGQSDVELAKLKLTAGPGEDVNVTRIRLTNTSSENNEVISSLVNVRLFDGATQVGSAVAAFGGAANGTAEFSLVTPLVIPNNQSKTLTVKADVNTFPNATSAGTNVINLASNANIDSVGAYSGVAILETVTSATGQTMTAVKTKLTVTAAADSPSGASSGGNGQTVAKFVVTNSSNPGNYSATLKGMELNIGSSIAWADADTPARYITFYKNSISGSVTNVGVASGNALGAYGYDTASATLNNVCTTGDSLICANSVLGFSNLTLGEAAFGDVVVAAGSSVTIFVTADTGDAASGKNFSAGISATGVTWNDGEHDFTSVNSLPLTGKTLTY